MKEEDKEVNDKLVNKLKDFVQQELDDGQEFGDLLEEFDIDPADAFVFLFEAGLIDGDKLNAYILDVE